MPCKTPVAVKGNKSLLLSQILDALVHAVIIMQSATLPYRITLIWSWVYRSIDLRTFIKFFCTVVNKGQIISEHYACFTYVCTLYVSVSGKVNLCNADDKLEIKNIDKQRKLGCGVILTLIFH